MPSPLPPLLSPPPQVFWYLRGALASAMLWYVFVQCTCLLFQCITTDIFAWYEHVTARGANKSSQGWVGLSQSTPCNTSALQTNAMNTSNNTNCTTSSKFVETRVF